MRFTTITGILIALLLGLGIGGARQAQADKTLPISDGTKVTLDYTLTLPDKSVADSTSGKQPFSYIHGSHAIIPGLEKALTGLKAGDKKRIEVPASEAYGVYDEKKKVKVPKGNVPPETKIGMLLRSQDGTEAKVVEVHPDSVLLDVNHPLAGKNLVFDVNILKVEKKAEK
jgi:FKBP-type peptidyl-prolyl cis-trans isomerase 2